MITAATFVLAIALFTGGAQADDWSQFRGINRDSVWKEAGIMQTFPAEGLKLTWRANVGNGLSSPVVAGGRVYLIGSELEKPKASERVHCLDEKNGQPLWTHAYEVAYPDWAFDPTQNSGPQATPIVHEEKLYTLGQMGDLLCLDAARGAVLWQKNLMKEYGTKEFTGTTPSPLIEGRLLILVPGVEPGACVMAFDKDSGEEVWRALDDPPTYSSPVVISAGGQRQLIVWTPKSVVSLDPATGKTWWREEVNTTNAYGSAPAVREGDRLLLSGLMFQLDAAKPAASVLWPEKRVPSKIVLSPCSIPMMKDGYVYSGNASGKLVCLDAATGRELWSADKITSRSNGATIHITPNGDTCLLFTDQGDLIRARLTPREYEELSRVHVVDPVHPFAGRKLIWPPPAYANGHILVHNGAELIRASLQASPPAR